MILPGQPSREPRSLGESRAGFSDRASGAFGRLWLAQGGVVVDASLSNNNSLWGRGAVSSADGRGGEALVTHVPRPRAREGAGGGETPPENVLVTVQGLQDMVVLLFISLHIPC